MNTLLIIGAIGAADRKDIQALKDADSSAVEIFINPYGGNVGVGTTSPGATFSVGDSVGVFTGIGLGNLIAKLKDKNVNLDPALTNQIHLINQLVLGI